MKSPGPSFRLKTFLVATFAILLWIFLTVTINFGGNLTALFYTGGARIPPPAWLAPEHIYVHPGSNGFDGQYYHYIAHDPLLQRDAAAYVDAPRLRYRRILLPVLAYFIGLGRLIWVDYAYVGCVVAAAGLGAFWCGRLAAASGWSPLWGLLFLLLPTTLISIDRMVADVALTALAAGFVLYGGERWRVLAVLAAASLVRETGLLLAAGYGILALWRRRWADAGVAAIACVPALAWYAYVSANTAPYDYPAAFRPLQETLWVLLHPTQYGPEVPLRALVQFADVLALFGVLSVLTIVPVLWLRRGGMEAWHIAGVLFALMGIMLQRQDHWVHVYDYGRVYGPLILFAAADSLRARSVLGFLPALMMLPRVLIQWMPQVLGIIGIQR